VPSQMGFAEPRLTTGGSVLLGVALVVVVEAVVEELTCSVEGGPSVEGVAAGRAVDSGSSLEEQAATTSNAQKKAAERTARDATPKG
jgi:hypothetical protein